MVVVSSHEAGLLGFRITESAGGKGDSPMTAKRAWVRKDLAINVASPVLVGHSIYGLGPKKQLFCLDIKTGKDTWSKSGAVAGPAAFISMLVMKDNLLVLGDSGNLYLIAADPKSYHLVSSTKVCGRELVQSSLCGRETADPRPRESAVLAIARIGRKTGEKSLVDPLCRRSYNLTDVDKSPGSYPAHSVCRSKRHAERAGYIWGQQAKWMSLRKLLGRRRWPSTRPSTPRNRSGRRSISSICSASTTCRRAAKAAISWPSARGTTTPAPACKSTPSGKAGSAGRATSAATSSAS